MGVIPKARAHARADAVLQQDVERLVVAALTRHGRLSPSVLLAVIDAKPADVVSAVTAAVAAGRLRIDNGRFTLGGVRR